MPRSTYKAGFNISTSDFLGRYLSYEFLPGARGGLDVTWSGIRNQSKFISHEMPLCIVQATAPEEDDPRYYGYRVPGLDSPFVSWKFRRKRGTKLINVQHSMSLHLSSSGRGIARLELLRQWSGRGRNFQLGFQ
jgi:hypothetical protein